MTSTTPPVVSIITPARNASLTVGAMIESVLAQTFEAFELIICDDGSTDSTMDIVSAFADTRIRLLRNPTNIGSGPSRDRAIAAAAAPWLAFIDADDAWLPHRLERLLEAANGDLGLMVFDDLMKCHQAPGGMAAWQRLHGCRAFGARNGIAQDVPISTFLRSDRLLIKPLLATQLVREHAVEHGARKFGQDSDFFLALLAHGARLRYVPEPMYLYRLTPGSSTANPQRHQLMRECVESFLSHPGFSAEAHQALKEKVAALRHNELYSAFTDAIRGNRWADAWRRLRDNPWIASRLIRRLTGGAAYNLHRRYHSGRGRGDAA